MINLRVQKSGQQQYVTTMASYFNNQSDFAYTMTGNMLERGRHMQKNDIQTLEEAFDHWWDPIKTSLYSIFESQALDQFWSTLPSVDTRIFGRDSTIDIPILTKWRQHAKALKQLTAYFPSAYFPSIYDLNPPQQIKVEHSKVSKPPIVIQAPPVIDSWTIYKIDTPKSAWPVIAFVISILVALLVADMDIVKENLIGFQQLLWSFIPNVSGP